PVRGAILSTSGPTLPAPFHSVLSKDIDIDLLIDSHFSKPRALRSLSLENEERGRTKVVLFPGEVDPASEITTDLGDKLLPLVLIQIDRTLYIWDTEVLAPPVGLRCNVSNRDAMHLFKRGLV